MVVHRALTSDVGLLCSSVLLTVKFLKTNKKH